MREVDALVVVVVVVVVVVGGGGGGAAAARCICCRVRGCRRDRHLLRFVEKIKRNLS